MTPNVKVKLREMDHLLDDEYVTVRVKMTKTETVEVEDKVLTMNEGTKKVKLGKTTERVKLEVERDITLLKDTKTFISRLITERGLYEPDVLKRASIDGGDKSLKLILNVFDKHQDPEITFPRLERKGNLCSSINQ